MTFRELPPTEWPRLVADGIEPFATHGLPPEGHWKILVCEANGKIVGVSYLHDAVLNHWHLKDEARGHPSIVVGLWRETKRVLDEAGVQMLHATVDEAQRDVQDMVERLGYEPAHGKLYLLDVERAVLNGRI